MQLPTWQWRKPVILADMVTNTTPRSLHELLQRAVFTPNCTLCFYISCSGIRLNCVQESAVKIKELDNRSQQPPSDIVVRTVQAKIQIVLHNFRRLGGLLANRQVEGYAEMMLKADGNRGIS